MNDCRQCRESLIALLETHTSKITAANDYLVNIKTAISQNKLDKLSETLSSPEMPVDDFENLELQRHQLLAKYGFSQDYQGFEECIHWCDNEAEQINNHYQLLVQSLVELQHSIQINSLLISKGRDRVRRSIGILTGLGGAVDHKTYSSSGKAEQQIGQRNIAVA